MLAMRCCCRRAMLGILLPQPQPILLLLLL
jgi:hypothetical protein